MDTAITRLLENCVAQLLRGELTEASLRDAFVEWESGKKTKQNILYLLANSTSLQSTVQSMTLYEDGVLSDGPTNAGDWPYQKISDAVDDGWRIVQFPAPPPLFLDQKQRFVPCEFILEKLVEVPS